MNTEPPYLPYQPPVVQHTVITDIDIPFGRMVILILKYILASIPALILVWICFMIIALVVSMLFGGVGVLLHNLQQNAGH